MKIRSVLPPVFQLLLLAIEDVWNFCRGNKSVLGEILENAGIDADAVRTKITGILTDFKSTGQGILDFLNGVFKGEWEQAWKGLTEFVGGLFRGLAGIIDLILPGFYKEFVTFQHHWIRFWKGQEAADEFAKEWAHILFPKAELTEDEKEKQRTLVHNTAPLIDEKGRGLDNRGNRIDDQKDIWNKSIDERKKMDISVIVDPNVQQFIQATPSEIKLTENSVGNSIKNFFKPITDFFNDVKDFARGDSHKNPEKRSNTTTTDSKKDESKSNEKTPMFARGTKLRPYLSAKGTNEK